MDTFQAFLKERILPVWQRRQKLSTQDSLDYTEPSVQIISIESHTENDDERSAFEEDDLSPISLLLERNAWEELIQECRSNIESFAAYRDPVSGNTLLHDLFAVSSESASPPLNVLLEVLYSFPGLVMVWNYQGCLPLHLACMTRTSSKVIEALVRIQQHSIDIPNHAGWYALHLLCHYGCSVESIRVLLEQSIFSVKQIDKVFCQTPLQLLNASKNLKAFHNSLDNLRCIRQRQRDTGYEAPGDVLTIERLEGSEMWQKVKLLVLAEYLGRPMTVDDDQKQTLLHSFISIQTSCPPALLEFAILLQVEELLLPAVDGNLPLHVAAGISKPSTILDVLLAMPRAARRLDPTGELPLQIVLRRFPTIAWCPLVESLIVANPMAIEALNIDVRLYPLILAKIAAACTNQSPVNRNSRGVNQLFEMISAAPSLFCKG
jgi:ankyrin repeat protein